MPSLVSTRIFEVVSAKNEVLSPSSPLNVAEERSATWPLSARIQPFCDTTTVTGSRSIIASAKIGDHDIGRGFESGAPPAELRFGPELLSDVADFERDHLPLLLSLASSASIEPFSLLELILLLAQRHFLEAAQAS